MDLYTDFKAGRYPLAPALLANPAAYTAAMREIDTAIATMLEAETNA